MRSLLTLAIFPMASVSLLAQLFPPAQPCPANTVLASALGQPDYKGPRALKVETPDLSAAEASSLEVLAYFTIAADGKPCNIRLLGSTVPALRAAVIKSLSLSSFAPARIKEQPVATRASIAFPVNPLKPNQPRTPSPTFEQALRQLNTSRDPQQQAAAVQKIEELSAQALPQADSYLAMLLLTGSKIAPNPARAVPLLQRASAKDDPFAYFLVGTIAEQGTLGPKDPAAAAKAYERAARLGYPGAFEKIAAMYAQGIGVLANPALAISFYRRCAASGNPTCVLALAQFLDQSKRHPEEALAWALVAQKANAAPAAALVQKLEPALPAASRQLAQDFADTLLNTRPPR